MPRRARLSILGVPWHIIQRGNNRAVCFYAEQDYHFFLHYLKEFAEQFGCAGACLRPHAQPMCAYRSRWNGKTAK